MILWRFAGEILHDENAWLAGTGIGCRQDMLDSYFLNYGLYTGNPEMGDTGYIGYNFHNQYLEVLVGTGIPGLAIFIAIIVLIFLQDRKKLFFPMLVYITIILFLFTESMLERQAGIVFFCLVWTIRLDMPSSRTLWN
jgi:O-antigen ligase